MFSVYDDMLQKPFTLDALAKAELKFDWFYSQMSPEQRDFYVHAAIEIGVREAARYAGQDVDTLTRQLGVEVYEPARVVPERDKGWSGPYAEYDAETRQITVHERGVCRVACLIDQRNREPEQFGLLAVSNVPASAGLGCEAPPAEGFSPAALEAVRAMKPTYSIGIGFSPVCPQVGRAMSASSLNGIAAKDALRQLARELLIAHELFHHLEATALGPVHRTLPPMTVSLLGGFWKARRYIKRTREIAAHSFAFTLLGMNERFPWTIDYSSTDRG